MIEFSSDIAEYGAYSPDRACQGRLAHNTEPYQALRDNDTCLSRVNSSRRAPNWLSEEVHRVDKILNKNKCRHVLTERLKVAVNTVLILSKNCMFFGVFRFAKNTNFLLKGGIHFFYMRIFRVQFRFSQVPRLVKFLDRIYLVQTSAQSNAHAQLCYQGLCQPPQYL